MHELLVISSKKKSKFYCYIGLGITASFVEHFYENQENAICVMNDVIHAQWIMSQNHLISSSKNLLNFLVLNYITKLWHYQK